MSIGNESSPHQQPANVLEYSCSVKQWLTLFRKHGLHNITRISLIWHDVSTYTALDSALDHDFWTVHSLSSSSGVRIRFMNSSNSKILSQFYSSFGRLCELMDRDMPDGDGPFEKRLFITPPTNIENVAPYAATFSSQKNTEMIKSQPISRLTITTWLLSKQVM